MEWSDLASDKDAWVQTSGSAGFQPIQPPTGDLVWGTVATPGATSLLHVDDDGLCTATQLVTGAKYWVAFYADPKGDQSLGAGRMGSIEFRNYCDWDNHQLTNSFCAEGIVMRPGMIL